MADDRLEFTPVAEAPMKADGEAHGDALYARDFVAWAERQASALRAQAAGAGALDWLNLAEEVETLGRSEVRGCRSQLERIIEHLLKLQFLGWPDDVAGWRVSVLDARDQLADDLTPTIERHLRAELDGSFERVLRYLLRRDLLPADAVVRTALPHGYAFEQIVGDWWPAPPPQAGAR